MQDALQLKPVARDSRDRCNGQMRRMSAFEARNRFGQLLDAVQHEPVTVTRNGRPVAVMLSVSDYERMRGTARLWLSESVEQMHREAQAKGLSEEMLDQLLQRHS